MNKKAEEWFQSEYKKVKKQRMTKTGLSSKNNEESEAPNTTIFQDMCFCFSEGFSFAKKSELTRLIKERGGEVTYILGKKCSHLLACREEVLTGTSSKIIAAKKMVEERSSGE